MYIPVDRFKVKVMFDTGATHTLMSRHIHQALCGNGISLPLEPSSVNLSGVSGKELQVDSRVQFPFMFGMIALEHPIIVVSSMHDTILVRNDLMDN